MTWLTLLIFYVGLSDAFMKGGTWRRLCILNASLGSKLETPSTISDMMYRVAQGIKEAKEKNIYLALVDIPLPVTGGTELDDWPGGIQQKYSVIRPMLAETMKCLNFSQTSIKESSFLYEEDAVGIWNDKGITIVSFPTTEQVDTLNERIRWRADGDIVCLFNQNFFLDPLSKDSSRDFLDKAEIVYKLEQLNMRGPGALPCRGVLFREFPGPFIAARRLDQGGYVILKEYLKEPSRQELETLFYEDSKERDKDLTIKQRIQRMIPQLPT